MYLPRYLGTLHTEYGGRSTCTHTGRANRPDVRALPRGSSTPSHRDSAGNNSIWICRRGTAAVKARPTCVTLSVRSTVREQFLSSLASHLLCEEEKNTNTEKPCMTGPENAGYLLAESQTVPASKIGAVHHCSPTCSATHGPRTLPASSNPDVSPPGPVIFRGAHKAPSLDHPTANGVFCRHLPAFLRTGTELYLPSAYGVPCTQPVVCLPFSFLRYQAYCNHSVLAHTYPRPRTETDRPLRAEQPSQS